MTNFIKANEVISAIENLKKEVREEATRTKEYVYKDAYSYGEDAIRLFFEKFTNGEYKCKFDWADKRTSDLKLKGSSKFVYIANVGLNTVGRNGESYIYLEYLEKCVEYNGIILAPVYYGKPYELYIFGESYIPSSKRLLPTPQKVCTVTDKKMQAWIDYLKAEKAAQEEAKNAKNAKIHAFKSELCEITGVSMELLEGREEGTIYGKMFNVAWYAEEKSGSCELHIRMNWNHSMDTLRTLKEKGLLEQMNSLTNQ